MYTQTVDSQEWDEEGTFRPETADEEGVQEKSLPHHCLPITTWTPSPSIPFFLSVLWKTETRDRTSPHLNSNLPSVTLTSDVSEGGWEETEAIEVDVFDRRKDRGTQEKKSRSGSRRVEGKTVWVTGKWNERWNIRTEEMKSQLSLYFFLCEVQRKEIPSQFPESFNWIKGINSNRRPELGIPQKEELFTTTPSLIFARLFCHFASLFSLSSLPFGSHPLSHEFSRKNSIEAETAVEIG